MEEKKLRQLLAIQPGVTAVIGSGGKTTLLRTLGRELADAGLSVILCTTTKIFPFSDLLNVTEPSAAEVAEQLRLRGILCVGMPIPETGKLTASGLPVSELAKLADYVLVEADGSAQLPLKAHAPHEPVIPPEANQTVCVVGTSGFGRPIAEAAHRPEIFAALAGKSPSEMALPEDAARVVNRENLAARCFFNQADTPERWEWARRAAAALDCPACGGSLRKEVYFTC
jgi:probable selenium-dependent hydroxylase accessory protein YqeC